MSSFLAWGTATTDWGHLFIPRNGGIEGKLQAAHFRMDTHRGGELTIVRGDWPNLQTVLRVGMVFQVRFGGEIIDVRQTYDRAPRIDYLEEGMQRLGIRSHFNLYDARQRYFGHGMVEIWAYPNGEIFSTYAASFESLAPYGSINGGSTSEAAKANSKLLMTLPADPAAADGVLNARLDFGTATERPNARLHHQRALLYKEADDSIELYWQPTGMRYDDSVPRAQPGAPTYHRWPSYLPQAYAGTPPTAARALNKKVVALDWPTDNLPPNPTYVSLFRLAPRRLPAPTANLPLELKGGEIHGSLGGYNDQEGAYTVRQTANHLFVRLPEVPFPQRLTLKIIGLTGHAGFMTMLDEEPTVPQLISQGGRADDPQTSPRSRPEGPADLAVLTVHLDGSPRGVEIRPVSGIHLAYLSRTPDRRLVAFDSGGDPHHSRFHVSLADGCLGNLRVGSQAASALLDSFLHWCLPHGLTPDERIAAPRSFQILKNGPTDVAFRYICRNQSERVESSFDVQLKAGLPFPLLSIRARLDILESWPYTQARFANLLPFASVDPADWWYDRALTVDSHGRHSCIDLRARTRTGDLESSTFTERAFFALGSSDRGNLLLLVTQLPEGQAYTSNLCLDHIAWGLDLQFQDLTETATPPRRDSRFTVSYQVGLWGTAMTRTEELIAMGRASLAAGRLLLDEAVGNGDSG